MQKSQLRVNFLFAKIQVLLSSMVKRVNKFGLATAMKKLFLLVYSRLTLKKIFAIHKMLHLICTTK